MAGRRGTVDLEAGSAGYVRILPGRIQLGGARARARTHPGDGALRARTAALFPARERAPDRQIQAQCADAGGRATYRDPASRRPVFDRSKLDARGATRGVLPTPRPHAAGAGILL